MREASKVKHPNKLYNIVLRVPGKIKNQLIDAAKKQNLPLSQYLIYCAWEHTRTQKGIPQPGNAQYSFPDTSTVLRAYLSGESVLMPCGEPVCVMTVVEVAGFEFCDTCNVRVR